MRMRLVLLGGGSALGQALIRQGAQENIGFLAPRPPEQGWDPASLTALFGEVRPDAVINLAFYFDWFQAEHPDESAFLHQEALVQHLAQLCQQDNAMLVQPSSYRVFDGSRSLAYTERDEVCPLDARGRFLSRIEDRLRAVCPRHLILRFGWLLDASLGGGLDLFMRRAAEAGELGLAQDRRGNPTLVDDAARVLLAVLKQLDCEAQVWGTYHYGGHEATTALTLGDALLVEGRRHRAALAETLLPLAHASLLDAAHEPQNSVLACKKILHTFGVKQRAWRTGLPALLDSYYHRA